MGAETTAGLVGRDAELARLLAAVDRALEGRASAVLLAGDAGVGKTRLLDELAARAAERGLRVLTGHCVDLGDSALPPPKSCTSMAHIMPRPHSRWAIVC